MTWNKNDTFGYSRILRPVIPYARFCAEWSPQSSALPHGEIYVAKFPCMNVRLLDINCIGTYVGDEPLRCDDSNQESPFDTGRRCCLWFVEVNIHYFCHKEW